jgi:hypothetical protein
VTIYIDSKNLTTQKLMLTCAVVHTRSGKRDNGYVTKTGVRVSWGLIPSLASTDKESLTHCICVAFVLISNRDAFPNKIKRLMFVMESQCIY